MLVSFIAVVFNEAKSIGKVHDSLQGLKLPPGTEIETIAIDGGSSDNSVEVANASGFDRVVELPGANIPVCRNAGIREAKGDWIAFVDGDCLLDDQWLIHASRLLTKTSPLILGWPATPPHPGTWVQEAWYVHWMNKNPALESEEGELVLKNEGFRMITTRNMIFHREVADKIGGFNEALSTGEDTDFVFRATMSGITTWGLPALTSTHLGEPDTLRKFYRQQVWHANRKAYKAIMENSGMKSGGNAPLFTALFLVAFILFIAAVLLSFTHPAFCIGLLPLPGLLLALSARTCVRANRPGLLFPLAVLYGAYGFARSIDLVGLSPHKPSWKLKKTQTP